MIKYFVAFSSPLPQVYETKALTVHAALTNICTRMGLF